MRSEWKECTIDDLGEVVGGATPSTKKPENYENGDISWITPKDLSTFKGRFITHGERNITEIGLNSCSTKILPPNTVLFSSRAPIGYVAIAAKEMCTNQGFKSVIPNADTDFMFLYYLLKYNRGNIENMGSGTTFKEVSGNTMKSIKVYVPVDIEEQRKIGAVLSAIDDKIELNTSINENLEQQAIALYQNSLEINSGSLVYTTIGEICDVKGGKRLPKGINLITKRNSHPYIRVRDLNNSTVLALNNDFEYVDSETQKSISRYIVSTSDVIISIVGTIGLSTIVHESLNNANLTENCVKITNSNLASPEFILLFLKSDIGQNEIIKGTVGAVQLKLPIKNIQAIRISLLPEEEMNKLDKLIKPIFRQISSNVEENQRLSDLRDALLPKLMSGEIDVSQVRI